MKEKLKLIKSLIQEYILYKKKRTIATEINNLRDGILDYPSLSDTKKTAYDNYIKAKKTGEIPCR